MISHYELLKDEWKNKHLQHLIFCLENYQDYYEDTFIYNGISKDGHIVINNSIIRVEEIIYTLGIYYEDNIEHYQTPFRDFIYLCFTDLVTDDVDILLVLDEE